MNLVEWYGYGEEAWNQMPIYPHIVEEHGDWPVPYARAETCDECGFCQCEELEGLHGTDCSSYNHSGAGEGYEEEE